MNPTSVTIEPDASDRLLTASAVIDTLPEIVPARSLSANSRRLQTMPVTPASRPYPARTAGSEVSEACFTKSRSRRSVMTLLLSSEYYFYYIAEPASTQVCSFRRTAAAVRFFSAGGLENGDICDMIKKIAIFRQNVE